MKICYLANADSIHTQRWVKYFADRGHEVHLISPRPFGDCNIGNVKLHLTKRLRLQIKFISFTINLLIEIIQIRKLIKKIKPDIIHAHYVADYGFHAALTNFHPFILSVWGSDVLVAPRRSYFIKMMVKYALKKADMVHIETEAVINIIKNLGGSKEKIVVSPFGVDTDKFSPEKGDNAVREELGLGDNPIVISTRNLKPIYDISTLIRAVPIILEKMPNVKFLIAGSGELEEELKKLAKSLKVANAIRFIGKIPHDELPKYLATSDIYVSTSLSDIISVSLLEAMACGLAPVVTDIEGNRDVIKDGKNGFLFPKGESEKMAEKIICLLENENIRKNFGEKNRKIIMEKYNWGKCMKKIEKTYEELVEGKK